MAGDLNALVQDALAQIINTGGTSVNNSLFGQGAQNAAENTFGRGLGISTVTQDALAKAKVDAALAAQNAQLSALGQAAGVAQQELNRGQQGSQFQQSLALQKKGLGQQRDIANKQLLAQGLGLGVGGFAGIAGKTFAPEITGGLRRLAGLGATGAGVGGSTEMTGIGQQIQSPTSLGDVGSVGGNIGMPTGAGLGDVGLPDLSGFGSGGSSLPDFSWMSDPSTSFNLDALSGLGDLSGLLNTSSNIPDFSQLWAP